MSKSRAVKFPVDILNKLKVEMPNQTNPERIRTIFNGYEEFKMIKGKVANAYTYLYGKRVRK